jgi:sulfofructose kinase
MKPKLIALGAICSTTIFKVDNIPAAPAKVLANDMRRIVDGMAVSAACAFQKLGGQASVWARVGDDPEAHTMRHTLADEGLDVSGLHTLHNTHSSQASVIIDQHGQRLVVPFHDPHVSQDSGWLPIDQLKQAGMLHCDVRWVEGAKHSLTAARALGTPTMVDGDVAPVHILQQLMPLADYAVFSDAGLLAYTGLQDVKQALLQVASQHKAQSRHVGASCGAEGYWWVEEGQLQHVPAPQVQVVDTLAAGDVFHGAFALALLEGKPVRQAAQFACVAASLKCTQFGGRLGCPTRAEVEAYLQAS